MTHPWQGAWDEWQAEVLPELQRHGQAIGDAARGGSRAALDVVQLYAQLYASFDPVTLQLLKDALQSYHSAANPRPLNNPANPPIGA